MISIINKYWAEIILRETLSVIWLRRGLISATPRRGDAAGGIVIIN